MTISRRINQAAKIKTLLNLSTSKRTFMVLRNPEMIDNADWFFHVHFAGMSLVYFSLTTETASSGILFA
jgi:hypothetical protein